MTAGLVDLTIILLIVAVLGIIIRFLKQPIILTYILAGVIIALFGFFDMENRELFNTFSELGIMFLLFLIGLEINYESLRLVGKTSFFIGIGQIIFTSIVGFGISQIFSFSLLHSAYIAIALTFSSTIIIVKLLSEKKDLNSLYGKISVGFLLVQDFVAILILIFLAGIQAGEGIVFKEILLTAVKGIILLGLMLFLGKKAFPPLFDKISKSQELLFLTSLAWCFGTAVLVSKTGFSIEIGGFLAGLALANSSEHFQISAKIKSLRDFFILIFFVILGSSLIGASFSGIILPMIVFSLFVLVGNPIIVMAIMGIMGYRKRTGFMCGVVVAQISEFSLILAALGLKLGHLDNSVVSLITGVGIITITASSYMVLHSEKIFGKISKYLSIFEKKNKREESAHDFEFRKPIVLIGAHRLGKNIAGHIKKEDLLIIDFDPNVMGEMKRKGYTVLFGDIADEEIADKSNMDSSKLIICTSPDFEDNMRMLSRIKPIRKNKPKTVARAENEIDAKEFYKEGADYVIIPHLTSGQYIGKLIAGDGDFKALEQLKKKDLKLI